MELEAMRARYHRLKHDPAEYAKMLERGRLYRRQYNKKLEDRSRPREVEHSISYKQLISVSGDKFVRLVHAITQEGMTYSGVKKVSASEPLLPTS